MYTNLVNVPESILFLSSCRKAVEESIRTNADLDHDEKDYLADFIANEASDYQIMSIVVDGELQDEKFDFVDEVRLFDDFKEMVIDNLAEFSSVMDSEAMKSCLYEVGPVSQEGISTAAPILEFLYESGVIYEKGKTKKYLDKAVDYGKKGWESAKGAGGRVAGAAKGAPGRVAGAAKSAGGRVAGAAKGAGQNVTWSAKNPKTAAKVAAQTAKDKSGWSQYQHGKQRQQAGADRGVKGTIPRAAADMKAGKKQMAKTAGAVALAAAAIYAGTKVYQRYMSQAGRACKGKGGAERTACMKNFRAKAIQGQIAATQKGMSACANSKNPDKCRASIQKRVQSLQAKRAKYAA